MWNVLINFVHKLMVKSRLYLGLLDVQSPENHDTLGKSIVLNK